ncbi:hypothetical protein [Sphingobacterium sp.]|uniref:hypothetical protein n=1 Tax=Sphingobacterium sp. TaxID=341027 RepID=UPI00289ED1A9|nr:hypothetical protein [Sphingobacterium sp.]
MISLLSKPQAINYSESLPDIILISDKPSVSCSIKSSGLTIVEERFDMGPNGTPVKIRLRKLLDHLLINEQPQYHLSISRHPEAAKIFQIVLNDAGGYPVDFEFQMINGFKRFQPYDLALFLRNNWLNVIPDVVEAYFHQPLFLSAFPHQNLQVKVKATMLDGSIKTENIGSFVPGMIQSANVNPGRLQQLLKGEFKFAEVYATDSKNAIVLVKKKIYYRGFYPFKADIFFYLNRLGGWDSLVLNGESIRKHVNTPSNAIVDEIEFQYDSVRKMEFEKTTGFISSKDEQRQFIEFVYSKSKFFLYEGRLIPIITSETQVAHTRGAVNSYTFSFWPSNTREYFPELGVLPSNLTIT